MNTEVALQAAEMLLMPWSVETVKPEPNRLDVVIKAETLVAAVAALSQAHWGYLAGITGLDLGADNGHIEALYHFCKGAAIVTLRVRTPRLDATLPSICIVIPAANLYERELREMLGVAVTGLIDSDHLFLPDDWPDGVYPLRKDTVFE
jgi:Ni,Fe-hydrogenase III component G